MYVFVTSAPLPLLQQPFQIRLFSVYTRSGPGVHTPMVTGIIHDFLRQQLLLQFLQKLFPERVICPLEHAPDSTL